MPARAIPHYAVRAGDALEIDGHPPLDAFIIRYLKSGEGWEPGMAPLVLLRGSAHARLATVGGWPFAYMGTTDDGNTIYESY